MATPSAERSCLGSLADGSRREICLESGGTPRSHAPGFKRHGTTPCRRRDIVVLATKHVSDRAVRILENDGCIVKRIEFVNNPGTGPTSMKAGRGPIARSAWSSSPIDQLLSCAAGRIPVSVLGSLLQAEYLAHVGLQEGYLSRLGHARHEEHRRALLLPGVSSQQPGHCFPFPENKTGRDIWHPRLARFCRGWGGMWLQQMSARSPYLLQGLNRCPSCCSGSAPHTATQRGSIRGSWS